VNSAERFAFLAAAAAWSRSRDERHAARMLRSPFSGVPYELGAAYVTLSQREGSLVELLVQQRIAAADAREAVVRFTASLRAIADLPESADDGERHASVERLFSSSAGTFAEAPVFGPEFELAEPVLPERGGGVRTQNARFSASQLNTYAECPRKWFYRYVCAAVEDKGSSASFYGTAFHAALEELHGEYPQPKPDDAAIVEKKLIAYVNAAFDRFRNRFETAVEFELQVRRARRTARKYVQWLMAEARRAPFTVIGCELPAELQLEGFDFIGYIDRLDRDDATGAVAVMDYKTGSIAASAYEYREKVRTFSDFQLPFYYWARTEAGDRVTRLALIPLKDARADVQPISLEVVPVPRDAAKSASPSGVIPIGDLERARTRMVELCREITSGTITAFTVAEDPDACTYCAYTASCAQRPNPPEQRFGR
jgi:RecB family exonuclease